MVFALIAGISLGFGFLLHGMARRRNCNPVLWGALGASFWFFPIPLLLMYKRQAPGETGSPAP